MKKRIAFLLLLMVGFAKIAAESNFRPGYIINNADDVIHGLIDYQETKANARLCLFKKNERSAVQPFSPTEIKAYRINDSKYYISQVLNMGSTTDTLFLEYLIQGKVNIYYYFDGQKPHYLVNKDYNELEELIDSQEEGTISEHSNRMDYSGYHGTLKFLFLESNYALEIVDGVVLSHASLINITKIYNQEVYPDDVCTVYGIKVVPETLKYGLLVGYNLNSFIVLDKISDNLAKYLQNARYDTKLYPSIGIFIKKNASSTNDRVYLQYEGTYSYEKLQNRDTYLNKFNLIYDNDVTLTRNVFNNTLNFRYEFPKKKIQPTLHAGIFANCSFNNSFEHHLDVRQPNGEPAYGDKDFYKYPYSNLDYGINLGVGIIGKVFNGREYFLDLRYQNRMEYKGKVDIDYLMLNLGVVIGE